METIRKHDVRAIRRDLEYELVALHHERNRAEDIGNLEAVAVVGREQNLLIATIARLRKLTA